MLGIFFYLLKLLVSYLAFGWRSRERNLDSQGPLASLLPADGDVEVQVTSTRPTETSHLLVK